MEDPDLFSIIFNCGLPLMLFIIGYVVGSTVEQNHFRRLEREEKNLYTIPISDLKSLPPGLQQNPTSSTLVNGSVVIGSDYFKTVMAMIRKLIGGEVRSFERLMERARREAICRMLKNAHTQQAIAVINVRLETSSIGRMTRNPAPMVEVIAYGTAILSATSA